MPVLVIGNISNDVLLIQNYLKRIEQNEIHSFPDLQTAIQYEHLFFKDDIKLVIYDAALNIANCEEHGRQISILKRWCEAPVLLSTTYEKPVILNRLFEVGIFDFILKPFDFIHFRTRVHVALSYALEVKLRKQQQYALDRDLAIAKNVQKDALTPSLSLPHLELDGLYITSQSLGGDMYCWYELNEDETAILLFDVMGHGIAASLITMSIRAIAKGIILYLVDPVLVMKELNKQIYDLFSTDDLDSYLVTAIYIVINKRTRSLRYVNAAHPAGVLFDQYGVERALEANSPILGLFPAVDMVAETIQLASWHRVVLYTDGLLFLQNDAEVDLSIFSMYPSQNNAHALESFAQQYALEEQHFEDDVTIVSMTILL